MHNVRNTALIFNLVTILKYFSGFNVTRSYWNCFPQSGSTFIGKFHNYA